MNQPPKILITGAGGFTGRHACRHFSQAGFDVTAIARTNTPDSQVKVAYCNLTDQDAVASLVKKTKPQYLLHLAGQNHVGQSWLDPVSSLENNLLSTLYVIEALRHENPECKICVAGSVLQFDLNDLSALPHPYSLSKTLQVLIAQAWEILYNMQIIIAKPSNLIGPGFSKGVCSIFAQKIADMEASKADQILEIDNLNIQRDFLDVRDVVRAYEILLTKGESGEVYEVASGRSYSLNEVVSIYRKLTAIDFEIKSRVNEKINTKLDLNPAKMMSLGWKPVIPLESSLTDILNFYRCK
ncbi:NAD-dependent epimerase/dehydratase family protein [Bacillus swezeyi]|uniref:NAD-dependent epimerase/dehydratase family protein n=1 Tax=Bacillus swezeyi TaxID=1925020 RepID=A0A5M8RKX7_9BACI|nr:NAD-dependent epimerase/dehydratase family protein [Bacillus swezeyi]KAA6447753.1 NAD-dependent epimerase/dehydratase family protein [Bacillus swezeyi]KAA6473879.1 NAD-dependent epimerase/dehydratase family protein [Bacillus swezeyi]TYS34338.1 NAD-dependent epimerase/dehydratase family protein [Bacillus swezeyi]